MNPALPSDARNLRVMNREGDMITPNPTPHGNRRASIDLGLAVLARITPPGWCWTLEEIAAACDVSHCAIGQLERRALRRLRARLDAQAVAEYLDYLDAMIRPR